MPPTATDGPLTAEAAAGFDARFGPDDPVWDHRRSERLEVIRKLVRERLDQRDRLLAQVLRLV